MRRAAESIPVMVPDQRAMPARPLVALFYGQTEADNHEREPSEPGKSYAHNHLLRVRRHRVAGAPATRLPKKALIDWTMASPARERQESDTSCFKSARFDT